MLIAINHDEQDQIQQWSKQHMLTLKCNYNQN